MRRLLALVAAILLAVVLAACGGGDDDGTATNDVATPSDRPPIRIGAKNFTEQRILGELYRQALEAKGFDVVLKPDVGSTEIIHRVLRRGDIDMYPEYVGVLLSEVAGVRSPDSVAEAYEVAKEYERKLGFTMLAQTPFSDSNALAVKPSFAARHGLRTIADLRRLKGTLKIAARPEFSTRFEGLDGLREVYGLRRVRVVPALTSKRRYRALDSGEVDVASVFTTEVQLVGQRYVVLDDPRGLFASGHVAPIVSDRILKAYGAPLKAAINAVSKTLTTPLMREMNAAVDVGGRVPAAVAREFLRAKGLG